MIKEENFFFSISLKYFKMGEDFKSEIFYYENSV